MVGKLNDISSNVLCHEPGGFAHLRQGRTCVRGVVDLSSVIIEDNMIIDQNNLH